MEWEGAHQMDCMEVVDAGPEKGAYLAAEVVEDVVAEDVVAEDVVANNRSSSSNSNSNRSNSNRSSSNSNKVVIGKYKTS